MASCRDPHEHRGCLHSRRCVVSFGCVALDAPLAAIPDGHVHAPTPSGNLDEVVARVRRYRGVGVQLPLLRPARPTPIPRLLALAKALPGS
jgi:hypothetical protein